MWRCGSDSERMMLFPTTTRQSQIQRINSPSLEASGCCRLTRHIFAHRRESHLYDAYPFCRRTCVPHISSTHSAHGTEAADSMITALRFAPFRTTRSAASMRSPVTKRRRFYKPVVIICCTGGLSGCLESPKGIAKMLVGYPTEIVITPLGEYHVTAMV